MGYKIIKLSFETAEDFINKTSAAGWSLHSMTPISAPQKQGMFGQPQMYLIIMQREK